MLAQAGVYLRDPLFRMMQGEPLDAIQEEDELNTSSSPARSHKLWIENPHVSLDPTGLICRCLLY